jgi:hypothetical protein
LQNRQRSPSRSFPEPEHLTHLATIWMRHQAKDIVPMHFAELQR